MFRAITSRVMSAAKTCAPKASQEPHGSMKKKNKTKQNKNKKRK